MALFFHDFWQNYSRNFHDKMLREERSKWSTIRDKIFIRFFGWIMLNWIFHFYLERMTPSHRFCFYTYSEWVSINSFGFLRFLFAFWMLHLFAETVFLYLQFREASQSPPLFFKGFGTLFGKFRRKKKRRRLKQAADDKSLQNVPTSEISSLSSSSSSISKTFSSNDNVGGRSFLWDEAWLRDEGGREGWQTLFYR